MKPNKEKEEIWNSIYISKPKQGQRCKSKIAHQDGYCGNSVYNNGYFETYNDHSNRLEITRWKHDLWIAID